MTGYGYPPTLQRIIDLLRRVPGVGFKSAQRIAFHLLKMDPQQVRLLGEGILELREKISYCGRCNSLSESDPCPLCLDPLRDGRKLCIVEQSYNLYSIEKTGVFDGRYFVLQGTLSPLRGIGPEEFGIDKLEQILSCGGVEEVILATNPTLEGEATSLFLKKILQSRPELHVTRLSIGLPIGSDIDYADEMTLQKAFEKRHDL